ncbi:DNA polymerase III subunit delta [Gammaproteobacteria bacterium]|nr:DNA polymerase III subunit delta [Gammaproteobacteria bacterium]
MICNATSIKKYLDKSPKMFLIYGSEIVLINDSADQINDFFLKKDFSERIILTKENFKDAQKIIMQNSGGSLFGSKIIIEIIHNSSGTSLPKDILGIFNIDNLENAVIIVRSAIKKINKNTAWFKLIDSKALVIECNKLKAYEEKTWVKNRLDFMNVTDIKDYTERLTNMFAGNLVAQNNEINLLKLTYAKDSENKNLDYDDAEFMPYELEDKIIDLDTKNALRIINTIKKNEEHYAQYLVSIVGSIINTSISIYQNKKLSLEKLGVWKTKIPGYKKFITKSSIKKLMPLQKKIYHLDLASKGLSGISKEQFWYELENMVVKLTSS